MTWRPIIFLAVLSVATAFLSCKKGHYVPINADLKASYNFKSGSYWIYRDSVSGQMDSFFVTKYEAGTSSTTPHNQNDAYHYDYVFFNISQRSITAYQPDSVYHWEMWLNEGRLAYYGRFGGTYPFYYYSKPIVDYSQAASANGNVVIDHYNVNGVAYPHAIISWQSDSVDAGGNLGPCVFHDQLFLAPRVGFVKMRLFHPIEGIVKLDTIYRVWELVRSRVVL